MGAWSLPCTCSSACPAGEAPSVEEGVGSPGRRFSPHSGGPSLGARALAEPGLGVRGLLHFRNHSMLHFLLWEKKKTTTLRGRS